MTTRNTNPGDSSTTTESECRSIAHQKAFSEVISFIEEHVISRKEVVELSEIRGIYVKELEVNGFPNSQFRGDKLKARLLKHEICDFIDFSTAQLGEKGCITHNLIYSTDISAADAIACAYKIGSSDKLEDAALYLRRMIKQAFDKSSPLPWPPSVADLGADVLNKVLPQELTQFLNFVLSGKSNIECDKTTRLVNSIGQVRCHLEAYTLYSYISKCLNLNLL